MSKIKTQADFEKDKVLKAQYGTYDQYLSSNNPSLSDYVSVAETGGLAKEQPKSPYDTYMEEAKRIYNQGIESNNQMAESQSASAGAEYREINRNINELNKASGKANTGYAGDTSIDAYNAYRNAVNSAYSSAQKSNNDLYSYYLGEMSRLQQAKENQEVTERQLSMQEQQARQQESAIVLSGLDNILSNENAYNENGTITSESAKQLWDYVSTYYGGAENIPSDVQATLNSTKGFSDWLNAYNGGTIANYDNKNSELQNPFKLNIVDENGKANKDGSNEIAVVKSSWNEELGGPYNVTSGGDNIRLVYNGENYKLRVSMRTNPLKDSDVKVLNKTITQAYGRTQKPGDVAYYNGKFYILGSNNKYLMIAESKMYDDFKAEFNKRLGITEKND